MGHEVHEEMICILALWPGFLHLLASEIPITRWYRGGALLLSISAVKKGVLVA